VSDPERTVFPGRKVAISGGSFKHLFELSLDFVARMGYNFVQVFDRTGVRPL